MKKFFILSLLFLHFLISFGQGDKVNSKTNIFNNIAVLSTKVGAADGVLHTVNVNGFNNPGDGGGGQFIWDNTSTAPPVDGMVIQVSGKSVGRWIRKYDKTQGVNVKWFGAVNEITDASNAIIAAHNTGEKVFYPKGRYKFTSHTNPNFASGIQLDNDAHIDGLKFNDIVSVDEANRVIGLQQNHLEESASGLKSNLPITTGVILAPPLSSKIANKDVSIIAHWYNDFGLESTRAANGAAGGLTWYYWNWNFTSSTGYDPARHPLLGWYRGDDPNVLDWQCYWLREYGVTGVNLVGAGIDVSRWQNPSNRDYWKFQLFNNVKNFKGLKYILWGLSGSSKEQYTVQQVESDWQNILNNFHKKYDNYFYVTKNGKTYPVIYLFEADGLRGVFDKYNGSANLMAFLISMGDMYKKAGFGGLCIFARHPSNSLNYTTLENNNVLYVPAGYSNVDGVSDATTYEDYVKGFSVPASPAIVNVVTSHESKAPHPSKWKQGGSTPQLFEELLSKAVNAVRNTGYLPKIIQIYNVAEWAEGGAMLQPNVKDGFKYLEAVKTATSGSSK